MTELVPLDSKTHDVDFDLIIWSKDVSGSRKRLERTLSSRNKPLPSTRILVHPAIVETATGRLIEALELPEPVFFENKQYDIEFAFPSELKDAFTQKPPAIEHRLRTVEDAFHYSPRTNSLRATVNTGNDIGWFKIELVYEVNGKVSRHSISFEVLPTKMDMASDLSTINSVIDEEFPLWRYSLAEKTQQQMQSVKKPHPDFLLLWFAQFEQLFSELNAGLKHIVNSPHSRLLSTKKIVRIDRLKGRFSPKLEEGVARAIADKHYDKLFPIDKKILSVDTPENRFIKSVISTIVSKLAKLRSASIDSNKKPEKQRLSNSFFKKLDAWQSDIRYFQRQPLFKEVGQFSGLSKESLVLQQKSGYAKVYKAWQQLKWHLDVLEGANNLSLRNVAELYEVWCFLEIRKILLSLGFNETDAKRIPLVNKGIEQRFDDSLQGSFHFERKGVKIKMAHEPHFNARSKPIKSWTAIQKPDVYLEVVFPNHEKIVWLFDAKYRVETKDVKGEERDFAPEDAINQMHRYRDALIHIDKKHLLDDSIKSRPVFGAYALYPGFYVQATEENPYKAEIEEVGIGAFSLLPSTDGSGSLWLSSFLENKLQRNPVQYDRSATERLYIEEAPRIPYIGTQVSRYQDLVIVANQLGPKRNLEYINKFKQGEADFYHTKLWAFDRQRIEHHIVKEARYLAVALDTPSGKREIEYIYPILKSSKKRRHDISYDQSGAASSSEDIYWLFELGSSLRLKQAVTLDSEPSFKIKLTSREELPKVSEWKHIPEIFSLD